MSRYGFLTVCVICVTSIVNFIIMKLNANHFDWMLNGEFGNWLGAEGQTILVALGYHVYVTKIKGENSDLAATLKRLQDDNDSTS